MVSIPGGYRVEYSADACLGSVINHHQQPRKMREITYSWLEDTSWLLPLGATVNALPHCSGGKHKRQLFPSGEGACWSVCCTTTKAEFFWTLYNLSLSLWLFSTLFLSFSRVGLQLSFLAPYNFYPHLIYYSLPLLTLSTPLPLSACLQAREQGLESWCAQFEQDRRR